MSSRALLLLAFLCTSNFGSAIAVADVASARAGRLLVGTPPDARRLIESEADIRDLFIAVVGRGNVPTGVVDAVIHKGWSVDSLRRAIRVIGMVDHLPGIQPQIAALLAADPDNGALQQQLSRLELIRKVDAMIPIVGINPVATGGAQDVLLADGTRVALVSLKRNPHRSGETLEAAAEHLRKVAPGSRHLIFASGFPRAFSPSSKLPAVIDADNLQLNGELYQVSLEKFFATKAPKPKLPLDVADRKIAELLARNGPGQSFIRWNPTAMTAFRELVHAQELDWDVLGRLLSDRRAGGRVNVKVLQALRVLGAVPGIERTIERMLASNDHQYQGGFVNQILQAAELHTSEGLIAMSMPLPGQSLDVDAISRRGRIFELKMLSHTNPLAAGSSIRDGHRSLHRQREALKVVRRYLPLPPEVQVGADLVLLTNRAMTSQESQQARANAAEYGMAVVYETESTVRVKLADVAPKAPAPAVVVGVVEVAVPATPAANPALISIAPPPHPGMSPKATWKRPRLQISSKHHMRRLANRKAARVR